MDLDWIDRWVQVSSVNLSILQVLGGSWVRILVWSIFHFSYPITYVTNRSNIRWMKLAIQINLPGIDVQIIELHIHLNTMYITENVHILAFFVVWSIR